MQKKHGRVKNPFPSHYAPYSLFTTIILGGVQLERAKHGKNCSFRKSAQTEVQALTPSLVTFQREDGTS